LIQHSKADATKRRHPLFAFHALVKTRETNSGNAALLFLCRRPHGQQPCSKKGAEKLILDKNPPPKPQRRAEVDF
jgi:hypothetical protein